MGGTTNERVGGLIKEAVLSLLLVTKTYLPFGVTATPTGLFPTGMGRPKIVFVAVLITEIVPSWVLATYAYFPSELIATPRGAVPHVMDPTTVFVSLVITETFVPTFPILRIDMDGTTPYLPSFVI